MARALWPSRKLLFRLHGWMGLNLGLLLFIVCFSGTIATLSHEIDWLFNPAMRATPAESSGERSWERWYRSVRAEHPRARLVNLNAPPAPGWAASATIAYGPLDLRHVYLHPGTAEVQGTFSFFNVARFFRSFHKQFYIYPGTLPHGIYAVGPLAFVLLVSAVTGLFFYRIRWSDLVLRRRSADARTFCSSLHRASGVWTVAFSIVFALTGVWYLAERVAGDLGVSSPGLEALPSAPPVTKEGRGERLDLDACVTRARHSFPELDVQTVYFLSRDEAPLVLYGEASASLVRATANHVVLDPFSGEILRRQDASDLSAGARLVQTADPLHFGTFGGLATKLLWFVAGLLISASILVGTRIWYLRVHRAEGRKARTPLAVSASLAVTLPVLALTVYGSVVNIGDSIAHEGGGSPVEARVATASVEETAIRSLDAELVAGASGAASLVPAYVWVVVGGFVLCTVAVTGGWLYWIR